MRSVRVLQVDAFTERVLAGNPAGVVLEAEGLSEAQMLAIARELNNSETAFVFGERGEGYDLRLRFFTARREVPICGHATIAAFYAMALDRGMEPCRLAMASGAGILPIEIRRRGGDYLIEMTQGPIEFGEKIEGDLARRLREALGLPDGELDERAPIQVVSTGYSKVMVPLKRKAVLDGLVPDERALVALSGEIGSNGFYAFCLDSGEAGVLTAGRVFAPFSGISEDPVTGNAIGPSGAYLVRYGLLAPQGGVARFVAKQGEAMGRKGYAEVEVEARGREPRLVRLAGRARIAFDAEMALP